MIPTTSSGILERLVSAKTKAFLFSGFYTGMDTSDVVFKNEIGSRRTQVITNVLVDWRCETLLHSLPLKSLAEKARVEFAIPTLAITKLGLIYRFMGKSDDPPVIKEFFRPDATKHKHYEERRSPDGVCAHPFDWYYEYQRKLIHELDSDTNIAPEIRRRLKDSFLITERTEPPTVMNDHSIMSSLREPFMNLVRDTVDSYDLRGVRKA